MTKTIPAEMSAYANEFMLFLDSIGFEEIRNTQTALPHKEVVNNLARDIQRGYRSGLSPRMQALTTYAYAYFGLTTEGRRKYHEYGLKLQGELNLLKFRETFAKYVTNFADIMSVADVIASVQQEYFFDKKTPRQAAEHLMEISFKAAAKADCNEDMNPEQIH